MPTHKLNGRRIPVTTKSAALVMVEAGYSQQKISDELGVSKDTIRAIVKSQDPDSQIIRATAKKIQALIPSMLYEAAGKFVEAAADPEKIAKAGTRDLAIAAGVFVDKARLMSGDSTANVFSILQLQNQVDAMVMKEIEEDDRVALAIPSPEVIEVKPK